MLPEPESAWPPKPYDTVFRDITEWAKLWKGTGTDFSNYRPTNKRGRWKRTVDAFFDRQSGDPALAQERQMHIPIAGDIYRTIGSLMFSSGVKFTTGAGSVEDIADDDLEDAGADTQDPVADALDRIANTDKFMSLLTEAAESGSALGGYVLRVVWDRDIKPDGPWIDRVEADHCIPEYKWGHLVAITFWSTRKGEGDTVYRHFQEYGRGFIRHALYEGNASSVGRVVPLTDHKMTSGLVTEFDPDTGEVVGNQGVDAEGKIYTGADDDIAAVYVPNRTPNPEWREDEEIRNLGMSDTPKDVIALMYMADEVWGSLMRDVDQAKGRVIIPKSMLDYLGPGKGTTFDYDREFYSPVGDMIDQDSKPTIEQVQFEIRVQEHLDTYGALLKEILRRCGISPLTFGITENVATTATEVRAWSRDTIQTVNTKRRLTSPELTSIVTTLLRIYANQWEEPSADPTEPVDIEWPDVVPESPREVNESVQMLFNAQSASISERVRRVNPTWTPSRIRTEVERIKEEYGIGQQADDPFASGNPPVVGEEGDDVDIPPSDTDPPADSPPQPAGLRKG